MAEHMNSSWMKSQESLPKKQNKNPSWHSRKEEDEILIRSVEVSCQLLRIILHQNKHKRCVQISGSGLETCGISCQSQIRGLAAESGDQEDQFQSSITNLIWRKCPKINKTFPQRHLFVPCWRTLSDAIRSSLRNLFPDNLRGCPTAALFSRAPDSV